MQRPKGNILRTIWLATLTVMLAVPVRGVAEDPRSIQNDPSRHNDQSRLLAIVNGRLITENDVALLAGDRLLKVKTEEYNAKKAILQRAIDDLVLQAEAARHKTSVEALLLKEAIADVREPDQDELATIYNSERSVYADLPEEVAIRVIAERIRKQRLAELRRSYARSLRQQFGVIDFLQPPRAATLSGTGPGIGPAGAPVQIIEFSDFQCPFCADTASVLRRIEEKYPTQVRVVFKNFPLSGHRAAPKAAEAAACAQREGRFWEMHDKLFANQRHLDGPDLRSYASDIGLDGPSFETCLRSGAMARTWQEDQAAGARLGIVSTPTLFVNGRMIIGTVVLQQFLQIVEEELQTVAQSRLGTNTMSSGNR